jgi:hypothetical protein
MMVDYIGLIPELVKAVKDLSMQNSPLQQSVGVLTDLVTVL